MNKLKIILAVFGLNFIFLKANAQWQIFVSNDVCMDYTWALSEQETIDYCANLIAAHLDAMKLTDNESWPNKARYTCTVTNEVFFFLEKFPERKDELIQRIREGRIMLSPFLVNTLWGFTGVEGFLRSIYPAKRLAVANKLPLEHGVHSESPTLPWGIATLCSGCGIRWINKPYLNVDGTFGNLNIPPVFRMVGPDNSEINVVLDKHACEQYWYMQGNGLLKLARYPNDDVSTKDFWITYYKQLNNYPLNAVIAEGTHSDLSALSASEVPAITQKIIDFNKKVDKPAILVNATFSMFASLVDSVQNAKSYLHSYKGGFGQSWELWPLGMAKYATNFRRGVNKLIAAETLLANAEISFKNDVSLLKMHQRAEWLMTMLTDHAWNGVDDLNQKANGSIRKRFSEQFLSLTDSLINIGFTKNGIHEKSDSWVLFNSTNYNRSNRVEIPITYAQHGMSVYSKEGRELPSQVVKRQNKSSLYFYSDTIPGFSFLEYEIKPNKNNLSEFQSVEAPFGVSLHKNSIQINRHNAEEFISSIQLKYVSDSTVIAQLQYPELISDGPVASIFQIKGILPYTKFSLEVIIGKSDETIDFNLTIDKKVNTSLEALYLVCNLPQKFMLNVETLAAVEKPYLAPKGDYLPGADTSRLAMQGFANAVYMAGGGAILTSPDAFCLMPSDTSFVVQLLGNNYDYKEIVRNQNNETNFDYSFSITPYCDGEYSSAKSHQLGVLKQMPLLIKEGSIHGIITKIKISNPEIRVTAYKPADPAFGKGEIIRLWNTSEKDTLVEIDSDGYCKAWLTDLLEQDVSQLDLNNGIVQVPIKALGFVGVRFVK